MEIFSKGMPARLTDVPNGQCFAFMAADNLAIAIKIAYPQSPDSRILILTSTAGQPPALQSSRQATPSIVYKQPGMTIFTGAAPNRLRNGIGTPQPGHVMQFDDDVYLGFLDEHIDPSAVSLKTGLINPNTLNGPAAVFETWQIGFDDDEKFDPVFTYQPAKE
ncbi:hypothetical protein DW352_09720 [Pseudolabrys taiwanensis]|uniref:Uncharacterized protein n=1 Tax=Pseudolabrys taiwanensis TaxID=331696 RepID=A0A345ZV15_9HYPH|nr:hypothetical protein [Pseudolabrys taiwanensis]AXK80762.1 hypothetical protein DW352_09720 [Pseudolabrys taiwanensis]